MDEWIPPGTAPVLAPLAAAARPSACCGCWCAGERVGMGGTPNFVHGICREKNTAVQGIPRYLFCELK